MTPVTFLDDLCEFIRCKVNGYVFNNENDDNVKIAVYAQELPQKSDHTQRYCPFILCSIIDGKDDEVESTIKIRIYFGTIDRDPVDSWRSLVNLMVHVRHALLSNRTLVVNKKRKGSLILPLTYMINQEQAHPLMYGQMDVTWQMYQPVEETVNYDGLV